MKRIIWFELSIAHCDFIVFNRSFSKFDNNHELIFYWFSFAIQVNELCILSNAFFCRMKWFSFLIKTNKNVFLRRKLKIMQKIETWRTRIKKIAIRIFRIVKIVEISAFEVKSLYDLRAMTQENLIFNIRDDADFELEAEEK